MNSFSSNCIAKMKTWSSHDRSAKKNAVVVETEKTPLLASSSTETPFASAMSADMGEGSCALPTVRVPAAPGTPTPNTRDLGLLSEQMRPPLPQEWGTEWQPAEPRGGSTLEMFYRGRLSVSSASSRKTEKALRSGCSSSGSWARGGAR